MRAIATIGLGIAKSVLQVHGVDAAGQVVICLLRCTSLVMVPHPTCLSHRATSAIKG